MAVKLHLLTGLDARQHTTQLLDVFVGVGGLGAAVWLAPSRWAAEAVLQQLVQRGHCLAPKVLSLPALVRAQRGTPRVSQQRLLVERLADERSRKRELAYFKQVLETRGFGEAALRLVDELTTADIAANDCQQASRIVTSQKWQACVQLYEAWTNAQRNTFLRVPTELQQAKVIILDGFSKFTKQELRFLQQLAARATAVYVALPWDETRPETFATPQRTREDLRRLFPTPTKSVQAVVRPKRATVKRPAGLKHLVEHLFRPEALPNKEATGVQLLAAPGELGEARMVAREVRRRLNAGVPATELIVAIRDLTNAAELLGDVFTEYGIPHVLASEQVLAHVPIIATLLRAAQLADLDWPFADVTALLRSTYFQPAWETNPEQAQHAEILLRLLGEPRGRQAYLRAIDVWADQPPPGLEDEQAEESRRQRTTQYAQVCRPFLQQFFTQWDELPTVATPRDFTAWLQRFAAALGLTANMDTRDAATLTLLWEALAEWDAAPLPRKAFFRGLTTIATSEVLPRSTNGSGAVRVVSVYEARYLPCAELFLMALGEGSFPRLTTPDSLIDDADRTQLRQAGLAFDDPDGRLADEQLLFLQLVATPTHHLTLSYAAVDEKGQPLLPGTFLRAVQEALPTLPVQQHRMLLEGYFADEPLSRAEARVQAAATYHGDALSLPGFASELVQHLRLAHTIATARFHSKLHNEFDGQLIQEAAVKEVQARFGAKRVFSPTALESYVACPFRFFLEHVLRLEELAEPGEEVEQTRRGSAYHRALSRLHGELRKQPDLTHHEIPESVTNDLAVALTTAIDEYIDRAPSAATKVLWDLERRRLLRTVPKYRSHWESYLAPWRKAGVPLAPQWLEADFGLPAEPNVPVIQPPLTIDIQGIRVQIGGRIDRVDVGPIPDGLGFWIIDYKTGRSEHYTAKGVQQFEKMQLPLYALAVEKVLSTEQAARPLGMAYWLVTEAGVKPVLPGSGKKAMTWLEDAAHWRKFRQQLEAWVTQIVTHIRAGDFALAPRSEKCTEYCSYSRVCRITQSRHIEKEWTLALPVLETNDE